MKFQMGRVAALFLFVVASITFAQVPVSLMPVPRIQFLNASGKPLSGGKVYTYSAGTTTPLATYTDSTGTVQNTNPVILNSGGFANIWLSGQSYKIAVTDSNGVPQWTVDNVKDNGLVNSGTAVQLNPPGAASQTIAGPLDLGAYGLTAATGDFASNVNLYSVNDIYFYADAFGTVGSTMDQRLQLCLNAVANVSGGTCDARGITGAQTWSTTVTIENSSTTLLLGSFNAQPAVLPGLLVTGSGVGFDTVKIIGQGPDIGGSRLVAPGGGSGTLIQLGDGTGGNNPDKVEVSGLYLDGNSTAGCINFSYATSPFVHDNHLTNCKTYGVSLQNSPNAQIGPRNYFGTLVVGTNPSASVVLDGSGNSVVSQNTFVPATSPGIRFTGAVSSSVSSRHNSFLNQTYAYELPLMTGFLENFTADGDIIAGSTSGWADVGLLSDGGGSNAPKIVNFRNLQVPSGVTTTLTAAYNLTIFDSHVTPTTILSGPTDNPTTIGVQSVSLRDNIWDGGLQNGAVDSSDLSAGQLKVGSLQYTGSPNANTGLQTATVGSVTGGGPAWSNVSAGVTTNSTATAAAAAGTGTTQVLSGNAFGFAIPQGAIILGIQSQFTRYMSGGVSGMTASTTVCLKKSTGATFCKSGAQWTWSPVVESQGGAADLWGTTWQPAEVNATQFALEVTADWNNTSGSGKTLNLGYFNLRVYYNLGGTLQVQNIVVPGAGAVIQGPTTPAVFTLTRSGGIVTGCTINNPGAGYTYTPYASLSGNGTGAAATLTVVDGAIATCTITNGGTGYTATATLSAATGGYAPILGGNMLMQWSHGTKIVNVADAQTETVPFPMAFPNACLFAMVSTEIVVTTGSGAGSDAMFQIVGPCTTTGVTLMLQAMSGITDNSDYTPVVTAFGW